MFGRTVCKSMVSFLLGYTNLLTGDRDDRRCKSVLFGRGRDDRGSSSGVAFTVVSLGHGFSLNPETVMVPNRGENLKPLPQIRAVCIAREYMHTPLQWSGWREFFVASSR